MKISILALFGVAFAGGRKGNDKPTTEQEQGATNPAQETFSNSNIPQTVTTITTIITSIRTLTPTATTVSQTSLATTMARSTVISTSTRLVSSTNYFPSPTSSPAEETPLPASASAADNKPYYIVAGIIGSILVLGFISYLYYSFKKDDSPPARLDEFPATKSIDTMSSPPKQFAEYAAWKETLDRKELPPPPQDIPEMPAAEYYFPQPQPTYQVDPQSQALDDGYYNNNQPYYYDPQQQVYYSYDAQYYPNQFNK